MFEHEISRLRRSLGLDQQESRSRWLAPVAIVAAGVGGGVALLIRRLRRGPQPAKGSGRKTSTSARKASSASGSASASKRTPAAAQTRKKASTSDDKRSTTGTTRPAG